IQAFGLRAEGASSQPDSRDLIPGPALNPDSRYLIPAFNRNARTPKPPTTPANGIAVPFANAPMSAPAVAPNMNCTVPMSAETVPATRPCGAIARPVELGETSP